MTEILSPEDVEKPFSEKEEEFITTSTCALCGTYIKDSDLYCEKCDLGLRETLKH